MNTEKCFVKYKVQQYKKPRLEKCKAWQEPWLYYENCCPAEEYDLFMLLKQKVKNKELITVKDLKEFLRVENKKFEETKIEIQAPKKEINHSGFVPQAWFLESIIFTTLIILNFLFKK